MKFVVELANNGWLIRTIPNNHEDESETYVGEKTEDEVESFINFLYTIEQLTGPCTSRYDEKRVRIIAIPGDRFEGTLDKEYSEKLKDLKETLEYAIADHGS